MLPKPYYQDDWVTLYQGDCRDIVPYLEPVDLVLTDPPYGIGEAAGKNKTRGTKKAPAKNYGSYDWDNEPIAQSVINAFITQPAIIFGGNYYSMPPSSCWFVWNKETTGDFADCELAWTNLPGAVRKVNHLWNGFARKYVEERWHCTQKPLAVMEWCIRQAESKLKKTVYTVLDPFAGSGTTLVAAKNMGKKAIGVELEKDYCEIIVKRLKQDVLFKPSSGQNYVGQEGVSQPHLFRPNGG